MWYHSDGAIKFTPFLSFFVLRLSVVLLLSIICINPAMTLFIFSSEHREPTEAHPPWRPGTFSDGRSCALPPRQSLSPPLSCGHPRPLACRGRSHSVYADDESLPYPAVFFFCIFRLPISFQPKLGMAKCRRNVENFLEACRQIGVPEVRPLLLLVFHVSHGVSFSFPFSSVCFHLWYSPQWTFRNMTCVRTTTQAAQTAILHLIKLSVRAKCSIFLS